MGLVVMKNVFEVVMSLSEVHPDFILKYPVSKDQSFHIWKQTNFIIEMSYEKGPDETKLGLEFFSY